MKKEYFEKLIEPLGQFKRRRGDNEIIFRSYPTDNLCMVCKTGWDLTIEKKIGYKGPYWRHKCNACKNHWQNPPIT